jgi:hypothetical protein
LNRSGAADLWVNEGEGVVFTPSAELILALSDETRQRVYSFLAESPECSRYFDLFVFPQAYLENIVNDSGLSGETIKLFRRLLYKRGDALVFSDVPTVLAALPDEGAKARFLRLLVRRPTLSLKLKVNERSDFTAMADYWGTHGRGDAIRALFQKLTAVTGGVETDIRNLLPSFAANRLQTFPSSTKPNELVQNCHWTALNFFNTEPIDAFLYPDEVEREMQKNYAGIKTLPQFGDLILFRNSAHEIVHSAVYIADRIIFTKNGEGISQPWSLMILEEAVSCYSAFMGPIGVRFYRQRGSMGIA